MASLKRVLVVIGSGGMGIASARRLVGGRTLILADASEKRLQSALTTLRDEGYSPSGHIVDVSSSTAVERFAKEASQNGALDVIVHTAGVSPETATTKQIYDINLVGTANVIDAFQPHLGVGTSMVCIASMAGPMAMGSISAELQKHFALAPTASLLSHSELSDSVDPGIAYSISKAANILRVHATATAFGQKGGRINSISPGLVYTPMGKAVAEGPVGKMMEAVVSASGTKRIGMMQTYERDEKLLNQFQGTSDDVAAAVAFLAGPESSFITGGDILVDGGNHTHSELAVWG